MTDRPMIGLMLALLLESAYWLKFRWEFDDESSGRTWQLCCVLIAFATVLIYLDGSPYVALPNLLTWLPVLLAPMQFVQTFGMRKSLPVSTFSFLAKQRRKRNERLGLVDSVIAINFGNVYFVMTMLGASLGSKADGSPFFLPSIIVLAGWMLLSSSRARPTSLIFALLVAGGIALAGQRSIQELDNMFGRGGGGGFSDSRFDPEKASTLIGTPAEINQSPDIIWRLRALTQVPPPRLLRTASYGTYRSADWLAETMITPTTDETQFTDLTTRLFEDIPYFVLAPDPTEEAQLAAVGPRLPRYTIRGSAFAETPLPLPGDAASLRDFELDGIERNPFGTVRMFPKNSVIEGMILWNGDTNPESPPQLAQDLKVPENETAALQAVLKELGLDQQTLLAIPEAERPGLLEKMSRINRWFRDNFRYTKRLKIVASRYVNLKRSPTAITQFLTTERSGHCEYFATSAALLLREAGIPTRYAIGYSVMEYDVKNREYVLRGTHGHAWTRVWDASAKHWIDFDTTPSSWMEMTTPPTSSMQRFNDTLKRIREDFFLWRNRPTNRLAASVIMISIGVGVLLFVLRRLWKSKRRLEDKKGVTSYEGPVSRTPLNALEQQAEKRLGPRPPGEPFGRWLIGLRSSLTDSGPLDEAIELHQRLRFDPAPPAEHHQERLAELARHLASAIKR